MPVSQEFLDFVSSWQHKAEEYNANDMRSCFDKFFTLYVVFNRIYAEATFSLARRCQVKIKTSFPDSKAATDYILQFVGANHFVSRIMEDDNSAAALKEITQLIQDERFYIKLDMVTGNRQQHHDAELLTNLESNNIATKAKAILETIYSVRCNMFHGHKGFDEVQIEILRPIIVLLKKTITITLDKLQRNDC